jgi:hypothetical protein
LWRLLHLIIPPVRVEADDDGGGGSLVSSAATFRRRSAAASSCLIAVLEPFDLTETLRRCAFRHGLAESPPAVRFHDEFASANTLQHHSAACVFKRPCRRCYVMSSANKSSGRRRSLRNTSPVYMTTADTGHLPQQQSPLRLSASALDVIIDSVMERAARRRQSAPGCLSKPTQLLIDDLQAVRSSRNACNVDIIIEKAHREEFDEFLSTSEAPQRDLVAILRANGLHVLAEAAIAGRYEHQ